MDLDKELHGLALAEAVFYARLGLQLEVLTLADVSEWVDEILLREDTPAEFFFQLYRILHTNKPEVAGFLKSAFPTAFFSVRPGLGWVQQQFLVGAKPLPQTIKALYRLRTLVDSDLEVGWIYGLAADYEQAAAGPQEVVQEVHQETAAFLACYQEYTFANRAKWSRLDVELEHRLKLLRP